MTTQHGQRLAEVLEVCRPVPPAKPNILITEDNIPDGYWNV